MSQQPLIVTSEITLALLIVIGIIMIILASIYDFVMISRRRQLRAATAKLRKPRQPHVTVLVYAHNNARTLAACLRSIERSRYRQFNIVVVDNKSTDNIDQVVKQYRERHTRSSFYVYRKRKASDQLAALREGYKKSEHATMVLVVSAASTLSPTVLKASVVRLLGSKKTEAVLLGERYENDLSIASLLPHFVQLSSKLFAKCLSVCGAAYVSLGTTNMLYQATTFTKSKASRVGCTYASDLAVPTYGVARALSVHITRPVQSRLHIGSLRALSFVVLLGIMCLMTYFMYTAATLQSSSLVLLSWLIICLWFLVVAWSDETATLSEKVTRTFCLPILYFLIYVWAIMYCVKLVMRAGELVRQGWLVVTEIPSLASE